MIIIVVLVMTNLLQELYMYMIVRDEFEKGYK